MPKAEPFWSPAASLDLDDIWDYYAENASAEIADRVVDKINAAANRVATRPMLGRSRTEFSRGLRSIRAAPYAVFYRILPDVIEIVRVLHERRDLNAILGDGEE